MASRVPGLKPQAGPPRPMVGDSTFSPPPPPDRNCRGQAHRPSNEKCFRPRGPVIQDQRFSPPPMWTQERPSHPFTPGGPKGIKGLTSQQTPVPPPPPPPILSSPAPTKVQEQKMKQNASERESKQHSEQQLQHSQESSNGAEPNSRKRSFTQEDAGNAAATLNSKSPALPKELTSKFGALKCDLCNVSVNSTVQARMHYTGKQHDKKVTQFLANWSRETGQPVPKRIKETPAAKKGVLEPKDMYCTVCDLALTSQQHAQQHYMGKNHLRALGGRGSLKSGSFNRQQMSHGEAASRGIGVPSSTDPLGLKDLPDAPSNKKGRFFCELCQVVATSQDQLDMHLNGAKHRKAEKAAGVGTMASSWTGSNTVACPTIPPPAASDSILASVIKTDDALSRKAGIKDYSIYRTPSGDYYCGTCTVICNRADVFHSHMISKRHARREKAIAQQNKNVEQQGNPSTNVGDAKAFLSNLKKTITGNVEKMSSNLYFCKLCDLSVNSEEELERHITTQEHMGRVGKSDPYVCNVCNLTLESEELIELHCTQEEHIRKLHQSSA